MPNANTRWALTALPAYDDKCNYTPLQVLPPIFADISIFETVYMTASHDDDDVAAILLLALENTYSTYHFWF